MSALVGARIVNTRAAQQAADLDELLRFRGAVPISFPCIEIAPPNDPGPLDSALTALASGGFDWLVLTSTNAVYALAQALGEISVPAGVRVAAVGESTAKSAQELLALASVIVPDDHSAGGLAASLPVMPGSRVLLPASSIARPELRERLEALGAIVTVAPAYQTVTGSGGVDLAPLLAHDEVDAVAFFSPSAVDGFVSRCAALGCPAFRFESLPVGCIGRTTAERARERGFNAVTTAARQTIESLVDALELAIAPARKGVLRCP